MAVVDVKAVYGTTIKQYYIGASTDTKPTDVQIGAKFLESDTNTTYIFGSDRTWVIDPEHQSLNKVWNGDTLEWERQTQPLVNISNASLFVELGSMDNQLASINFKLTSMVSLQENGITVNVGSVTSAISTLTSVQVSTTSLLASLVTLITTQNSGVVSNNSQMASLITIADATSTRVGAISTTLNNISTIGGKISNVLSAMSNTLGAISTIGGNTSNVLSAISNVLSGISARLSALSTAIGSTNALLASMEAWQDPLAKFGIGFMDTTSATSYYGFQGKTGDWYAMRISNGSYLYYYDSANFDTRWASRHTLSYTSFAGMF
jgi:hypothetical protein